MAILFLMIGCITTMMFVSALVDIAAFTNLSCSERHHVENVRVAYLVIWITWIVVADLAARAAIFFQR